MASVSLRCCFHQVTSIDPLRSGPRIAFSLELDPLSCWPRPLTCQPTKSTAAKATPAVTRWLGWGGGRSCFSIQMLFRGWGYKAGCGCKSIVCAAVRRDFSVSSLTLGLAVLSAPSVQVPYSQVSAPEAAPEHRSLLMVEEVHGGGRGWGSIEPTWVGALPGCWRGRGQHRGRGATVVFFSGHQSAMAVCCMMVQASAKTSPFIELLPPSVSCRMSPHSPQQSSAWVCSPDLTFQHPALVCSSGHSLRLGGQGRGQYPVYRSHSLLLPQTVGVFSSHREWGSPSVSSGLPLLVRSFSGCGDLSSLQIPPGLQVPLHFLSCSFSFFFLLSYLSKQESFLTFSLSTACVHRGLWKFFRFWCILVVFVERDKLSLPDPLASWSFCLYFIFKQAKDSSLFSKSLRIFPENSR